MPFEVFEGNRLIYTMMVFHVISLMWNIAFIINFMDFLASSMMGFYYFSSDNSIDSY